jgi:magnesium transporter
MVQGHARAAQDHAARRASLTDHASYLSNKITFVLDAMLGVVNLEQNNIIKLFSVMAVVLMPPTLIASIYGMNFKIMPELEWAHGYPIALVHDAARRGAAVLFFKWKKWLSKRAGRR